jgi:hypothetical protein
LLEPLRKTGRKWLRQIHGTRPRSHPDRATASEKRHSGGCIVEW